MVHLILVIVAVICFALAALGINPTRIQLGWAGLFFYVLASLV